jgi:hypothetical protein
MKNFFKKLSLALSLLAVVLSGTPALAQSITYVGYNVSPLWDEIPASSVVQGNTISLFVRAEDNNGDQLTYTALRLPDNASFNPLTRVFSFSPKYDPSVGRIVKYGGYFCKRTNWQPNFFEIYKKFRLWGFDGNRFAGDAGEFG